MGKSDIGNQQSHEKGTAAMWGSVQVLPEPDHTLDEETGKCELQDYNSFWGSGEYRNH